MSYQLKSGVTFKKLKKMKQFRGYGFARKGKVWYIVGGGVVITQSMVREDDSMEGILTLIKLYNLGLIERKKESEVKHV